MMHVQVPPDVLSKPPGSLVATLIHGDVALFVRETEWSLKRYPPACPADLRLGSWEFDQVLLVVLVLRFARNDDTTFDFRIDVQTPLGVRILQGLASQSQVEVHLAADHAVRTLRVTNPLAIEAGCLVDKVRALEPWSAEDTERALTRLNQLYPTARDLWWACAPGTKG
jgi:hypothetical protein